jgi:hypothetical protein
MLTILVAALALLHGTPQDTTDIYSIVLREIRTEYPDLPVVLAETRSGVSCMPHCGAQLRELGQTVGPEERTADTDVHSAATVQQLRELGLVQETCEVQQNTFGCGPAGHLFVGLGSIEKSPRNGPPPVEGALWVKAAVLVPCAASGGEECRVPEALGWWFLVSADSGCEWSVVRRLPAFAI